MPANADATRVAKLIPEFTGNKDVPAILVFVRAGGLTDADRTYVAAVATKLAQTDGVSSKVSPPIESDDHAAIEIFAPISGTISDTVAAIRSGLDPPAGLSTYVTGPAGFTADLVDAFSGIDGILLLAALGSVFLILLLVYRSPLLPLIVLGTAVFSLTAAILAVWWLAYADIVKINGQVQGILFILVIGAATDYSLLYVSRYREALRVHERRWDATWTALRGAFGPILASGGTVIVALLCLLFSDLNSNKALGPVAAIGIGFALLGALTLLPALLLACGRAAFWPFRPKFSADEHAGQISNPTSRAGAVAARCATHRPARPNRLDRRHRRAPRCRPRPDPVEGRRGRPERTDPRALGSARRPDRPRRALPGRVRQSCVHRRERRPGHRARRCRDGR